MTTDERLTRIEDKIDALTAEVSKHRVLFSVLGGIGSIVLPIIVSAAVSAFVHGCQ